MGKSKNNSITACDRETSEVTSSARKKRTTENFSAKSLAIDIFSDDPWLENQLKLFIRRSTQSLKLVPKQELKKLNQLIETKFRQGARFEALAKDLELIPGFNHEQAIVVARSMMTKISAFLTQIRQQSAGIETYRWQTSGDERVRKSHRALDGKICKWNNPNVYFNEASRRWESKKRIGADPNHPGESENCRCVALPRFDDFE